MTATFWTGFVCGRVAAIDISRRIPPSQMLAASLALLILASVVFVVVAGPGAWLWVVVFVIGLVIAPQFAAMIAFAEEHLALSGGSTSAFIAAAGLGGLTLPWLLGRAVRRARRRGAAAGRARERVPLRTVRRTGGLVGAAWRRTRRGGVSDRRPRRRTRR